MNLNIIESLLFHKGNLYKKSTVILKRLTLPRDLCRKRGLQIMSKLFLSEVFTNTVTETESPEGTKELDWMAQLTICRFFLHQAAVYLFFGYVFRTEFGIIN